MSLPTTPHDALFRALVSNPSRAGALLAEYLPQEVADLLDPGTPPEKVEGSFVDADAARTQCDALFRVRLKTGHHARLYVLLEHKSNVDAIPPDVLDQMTGGPVAGSEFGSALSPFPGPDRWEAPIGTVAEAWIEQGRAEGVERGRTEGLAQGIATGQAGLLLRQLE